MWTNFVKFGDPTPDTGEWSRVTKDDIRYRVEIAKYLCHMCRVFRFFVLDSEMKMDMDDDYIARMQFWDYLPYNITLN